MRLFDDSTLRFPFLAGSGDLLRVAKAAVAEFSDQRQANITAVVFSAAAIEAFLDELATMFDKSEFEFGPQTDLMQRVLVVGESARLQPLGKIRLIYEVHNHEFDAGRQPYQDYSLLKQIRDAICHAKATVADLDTPSMFIKPSAIATRLYRRGLLTRDPSKHAGPFFGYFDGNTLGNWAIQTATAVVDDIVSVHPDGSEFKQLLTLAVDSLILDRPRRDHV